MREDRPREERDRFETAELGIVLSHYDLGVIDRIREYRRGSRRSPKVLIRAAGGEFLLKRRAPGRDDPRRVTFSQNLQLHLARRGYPVPGFHLTRRGTAMLRLDRFIYEMFRYVPGVRDEGTRDAAREAGRALGRLHHLLADQRPAQAWPAGSYHAAAPFDGAVSKIPAMVTAADADEDVETLRQRCGYLQRTYHEAAQRAVETGLEEWPQRVIHGDWHPGNLLFRNGAIVAVLDFDSARVEPRFIDVANAALQFSMTMTDPERPEKWPDHLDVKRIRALFDGYDETADDPISPDERSALPWLILEALILESVLPIAATGRFARIGGGPFLAMVERKVRWLRPRAAKLAEYMG